MCGIAGFFGPMARSQSALDATLSEMRLRGPDGLGLFQDRLGENRVQLLHSRLAVIDLADRANQPLIDDDCALVFNGEIYNYIELRDRLRRRGHVFKTEGDGEVILKGYQEWGEEVVQRLEGMWAFALFDQKNRRLMLSRDPFGEKPLYMMRTQDGLYFGSEIKFIRTLSGSTPSVNHEKVRRFLVHGYRNVFKDETFFYNEVQPLPRASYLSLGAEDARASDKTPLVYWKPIYQPLDITYEDAVAGVREWLFKAIQIRMRADTPMALTLSGGIDSNVIAGVAVKHFGLPVSTFSMLEARDGYDERALIEQAARSLGTPHYTLTVESTGFLERLGRMTHHYEAPVLAVGMYLEGFLAQAVSDAGFKVVINGNGSDELFTGYYDHMLYWLAALAGAPEHAEEVARWHETTGKFVRNPIFKNPNRFIETPGERRHLNLTHPQVADFLTDPTIAPFEEKPFTQEVLRNRMLNELVDETVPAALFCGDNNWMHYSIENRTAYLDRGLFELIARIPSRLLIQNGYTKSLLRDAARGYVPDEILYARQKFGFNASMTSLLDREDDDVRDFMMAPNPVFDIIDRDKLETLMRPDADWSGLDNLVFNIASAKMFYDTVPS